MKQVISFFMAVMMCCAMWADEAPDSELMKSFEVADSLHSIGRTDSAAIVGERTIALATESGNPTYKVAAYSAQGVYLRSLGRINDALDAYNRGLEIVTSGAFRENPDQDAIDEIASLYINLAVLNLDMQNKDEATTERLLTRYIDWQRKTQTSMSLMSAMPHCLPTISILTKMVRNYSVIGSSTFFSETISFPKTTSSAGMTAERASVIR